MEGTNTWLGGLYLSWEGISVLCDKPQYLISRTVCFNAHFLKSGASKIPGSSAAG